MISFILPANVQLYAMKHPDVLDLTERIVTILIVVYSDKDSLEMIKLDGNVMCLKVMKFVKTSMLNARTTMVHGIFAEVLGGQVNALSCAENALLFPQQ